MSKSPPIPIAIGTPNWGTLRDDPGILKPPASGGGGGKGINRKPHRNVEI